MSERAMEREIIKRFKSRGWSITAGAIKGLLSTLQKDCSDDWKSWLKKVCDDIKERSEKREVKTTVIDEDVMKDVIGYLTLDDDDREQKKFKLIDSFNMPRISFDEKAKSYNLEQEVQYSLHSDVDARARMYRERLLLATQRAQRVSGFGTRGINSSSNKKNEGMVLSTIEALLGETGKHLLLGMLTQPEEGKWFLEDLASTIWLDLSEAACATSLYCENTIVIVAGGLSQADSNRFKVDQMVLPPGETREDSIRAMDILDPFQYGARGHEMAQQIDLTKKATNVAVVVISDLDLSSPVVTEKLKRVFEGWESQPAELLFVLMGPFATKDFYTSGGRDAFNNAFKAFGETLSGCPRLRDEARFLLVPSTKDPGTRGAWPRRPLPEELVDDLKKRLKLRVTLASNPCRVLFYNHEMVFFRDDIMKRSQRHLIVNLKKRGRGEGEGEGEEEEGLEGEEEEEEEETKEEEEENPARPLVETLIDQAHMFPLPPAAKPVYWELDYAMRLSPLPHLLVLADHSEQYEHEYKGCNTVMPGSFTSDGSFLLYMPATRSVQFSRVD